MELVEIRSGRTHPMGGSVEEYNKFQPRYESVFLYYPSSDFLLFSWMEKYSLQCILDDIPSKKLEQFASLDTLVKDGLNHLIILPIGSPLKPSHRLSLSDLYCHLPIVVPHLTLHCVTFRPLSELEFLYKYFPFVQVSQTLPKPFVPSLTKCGPIRISIAAIIDDEHSTVKSLLIHIRDSLQSVNSTELILNHSEPSLYLQSPITLQLEGDDQLSSGIFVMKFKVDPIEIYILPNGTIVEPAFTELFLCYETKTLIDPTPILQTPTTTQSQQQQLKSQQLSLQDTTISLGNWTPSQEIAPDHKTINKNTLKKLMLLSLRHVGVDKNHREFASIWKHLYCGCLFAFRRELSSVKIEQSAMLSVIRSNLNFLNIQ